MDLADPVDNRIAQASLFLVLGDSIFVSLGIGKHQWIGRLELRILLLPSSFVEQESNSIFALNWKVITALGHDKLVLLQLLVVNNLPGLRALLPESLRDVLLLNLDC